MNDLALTLLASFAAIALAMTCLWVASLALRNASIVDVFWGPGFVLVAWLAFALGDGEGARKALVAVLTSIWGLRLGGYLWWRNRGGGEDPRYRAMRRHHGDRFPVVSLYTVFGLQGVLMWVVSLPVQSVLALPAAPGPCWLDGLGVALFATGLVFETAGDWQLARFRADAANAGRVMDRGLWAWTRHPNYFGDFVVWWGLFCFALAAGAPWSIAGPAVMSVLLLRVSGVALLERGLHRTRPGYAEYCARTPAFFPRPPR